MNRPTHALSIKQPWAFAILALGKWVENRAWFSHFRGRIAIHAGKSLDREAVAWLRAQGYEVPEELPLGAFVGEVTITDCWEFDRRQQQQRDDFWACGPYCFGLALSVAYAKPIPARGQLGFWPVDWEALEGR